MIIVGNFEDWTTGIREMWNLIPEFAWDLFVAVTWAVRALAIVLIVWSLGEMLFWNRNAGFRRVLLSSCVLLIVTAPFLMSEQALEWPQF
jgi:hypothetical protein